MDINVTTEDNTHINVEMQLVNQYNMIKRTIYYLSKMVAKQLDKGDNYSKLNKTITINILDFDYLEDENFHSSYRLYEDITRKLLTDVVEIRFIELRKFAKSQKDYNNKLHRWLSFLLDPKGKEIDALKNEDNEIKEAVDVLYKISGNKDVVDLAELREKAVKDEISRLQGAKVEGEANLLIRQLTKKFKTLPDGYKEKILNLSSDAIEIIAIEIFDMKSIEDLKKYIY